MVWKEYRFVLVVKKQVKQNAIKIKCFFMIDVFLIKKWLISSLPN